MAPLPTEYVYFHKKCTMTGTVDNLSVISGLIQPTVMQNQSEAYRMEWAWGLPRGGLMYYLTSPLNDMWLRTDIAELYARGEFILAPTFKTYIEAMEFSKRAGFADREKRNASLRRPLTALCPPSGLYRYIYFPLTDAARKLQDQLQLQSQTEEDWNMGIHPATGRAVHGSVRQYPVVEAPTHPVSVCSYMLDTCNRVDYSALESKLAPFRQCLWQFLKQWSMDVFADAEPPSWFINDCAKGWDDETLCSSEATGYLPIDLDEDARATVPRYASSDDTEGSQSSSRVLGWLSEVERPARASARPSKIPRHTSLLGKPKLPHSSKRPTLPAVHPSNKLRPSKVALRTRPQPPKLAPTTRPSKTSAPPNVPSVARTPKHTRAQRLASTAAPLAGTISSPCRRLDKPMIERCDPRKNLPAWVNQDAPFPSHTFSSNDWALFYYGVPLGPTFPSGKNVAIEQSMK
ncbi:hypothetical protein BD626DRAFT_573250 [Schizophyllum amplum]|uniref:Uncharacterized protein n=1 Tax=Schizophyllum amplum TaxID=97359 RepID=A0A550C1W5_9AGAR|nr:hypothetical protein BD626DRAFT_573250 [Auriculariopsis ampla]